MDRETNKKLSQKINREEAIKIFGEEIVNEAEQEQIMKAKEYNQKTLLENEDLIRCNYFTGQAALINLSQGSRDVQEIDEKSDYAVRLAGESLGTASNALDTALTSYNIAYTSILSSYETYNLAYTAINISYESLTSSNIAYEVANKASYDVGYSTIYGTGYTPIEFNDISAYTDLGYIIYYYNSSKDIWYEALEPYNSSLQYHVYIPTIVGTGLTKRVEDVEDIVKYWDDKIENTTEKINQSLYNLTVENTSELINLEITPEEYNGDPHRNLLLNVYEGYINHVNGEIVNNGIINMYTLYNFYSYISSWEIIDVNNLTKI